MQNIDIMIEKMFDAGAHYGYSKTRRHPSVSSFIYTTKNKTDIINLEKTKEMLEKASTFVKELGSKKKTILFIGTKPEAQNIIKNTAEVLNMPYVIERWIGGTLSNFPEIKKRITELENYLKDNKSGELQKYTKKERNTLSKKMEKLSRYYVGLLGVKKTPDAIFVIDAKEEKIAVTEAIKYKVPVIALLNSDTNIKDIAYPILANDAAMLSIKFFTEEISKAYKAGEMSSPAKEL